MWAAITAISQLFLLIFQVWIKDRKKHSESDIALKKEIKDAMGAKGKDRISRINAAFVRAKRMHS